MSRSPFLHYLYDPPLPNRHAATLQILQTGAALARRGVGFTLWSGPLSAPVDSILADLGISETPGLTIRPLFADPRTPRILRGRLSARLARAFAGERHDGMVWMSRGETGVATLPKLARMPGCRPLVMELHRIGSLHREELRLGRRIEAPHEVPARALRREQSAVQAADRLVCLTEPVADAVREHFAAEHPTLILPSGTSIPEQPVQGPSRDIDLIYFGKLEPRKGIAELLDAAAQLPDLRCAVIGGAPDTVEALRATLEARQLQERVQLTGWLSPRQLVDWIQRARLGVCPLPLGVSSVAERFTSPMKLLSMMAHGLPVVATDLPPVRAIARDGHDALLVPPGDPAGLAGAIRRLLEDRDLAARLGAAARARAREFSWERRAERLATFLWPE